MNLLFPNNTNVSVKLDEIFKSNGNIDISERMSTRMVKCASSMNDNGFIGWQLNVKTKGIADMYLFGSDSLGKTDLEWISENTAKCSKSKPFIYSDRLDNLYEISIISSSLSSDCSIGFGTDSSRSSYEFNELPMQFSTQFDELIKVFRTEGAIFRAVVGKSDDESQKICKKKSEKVLASKGIDVDKYIGKPVKMRVLLRLSSSPSIRMKTVIEELVSGSQLNYIGCMSNSSVSDIWDNPLINAHVLPDYAARIMIMEPILSEAVIGIDICEKKVKAIPATHKNYKCKNAVIIGKAYDVSGQRRNITIGEMDLRRHYQIVGQTGTGKSTLISQIILDAVKKDYGLTFFDPHGTTIDTILRSLSKEDMDRVRVVRIGDAENPVPLNIWESADPFKEEKNISELCELFSDIFDPKHEGIIGPRYERWLSVFLKASLAMLGNMASFESITVLSRSKQNMEKLAFIIEEKYPQLASIITEEYVNNTSPDFVELLSWLICKFQRLTSVEQLRKTLGAGANALDFKNEIDSNKITLIDLASPVIGTNAARIVGTLTLMNLWNAALGRKNRERTHMVIVDEAALFQTNPMPRMLAESRKFGISMVLCHQHEGQLTPVIRDALEANSANFSAFRLSPKDAAIAALRFDNEELHSALTRLDAFNAVTSLSVNGIQSAPFTLQVNRPSVDKNGEENASKIEKRSIEKLVNPYRNVKAYTIEELSELLDNMYNDEKKRREEAKKLEAKRKEEENKRKESEMLKNSPDWLKKWNKATA